MTDSGGGTKGNVSDIYIESIDGSITSIPSKDFKNATLSVLTYEGIPNSKNKLILAPIHPNAEYSYKTTERFNSESDANDGPIKENVYIFRNVPCLRNGHLLRKVSFLRN